jgi:hypothetical protein
MRGKNRKPTLKPTFDYLLSKYTKAGLNDRAMKRPRSLVRQERREQPKQTKPGAKGVTPRVMALLITLIKDLIKNKIYW